MFPTGIKASQVCFLAIMKDLGSLNCPVKQSTACAGVTWLSFMALWEIWPGNQHKYSDAYAVRCAMSNKVLCLLPRNLVCSAFLWHVSVFACKEGKRADPSQFLTIKIGHIYVVCRQFDYACYTSKIQTSKK